MVSDRLRRLTEQQRICLRYVYSHMTSKEIAPLLGIEPGSVDQHIKAAMRILGVDDRRAAARMLAEHEGVRAAQPLVYQPLDIAIAPQTATFGSSIEVGRQHYSGSSARAMREEQTAYAAAPSIRRPTLPLPIAGARPHDVGLVQRLAWIAAIAIGGALAFGTLISGIEALTRLVRG